MHYDFKLKMNKIDSQQYKNFNIPEIDWLLNSAYQLFVKMVTMPRLREHLGFEIDQRTRDDVRPLVVRDSCGSVSDKNIRTFPDDYWHYLGGKVTMTKGNCSGIKGKLFIRQHDDEFETSPFDSSSFEWRTVNAVFSSDGIQLFTDGTFTITEVCINYLKELEYIHNAKDFEGGKYKLPSGKTLFGHVDCELPVQTHKEIVDIAVLLATGQLQIPDYELKLNKLKFNNLK